MRKILSFFPAIVMTLVMAACAAGSQPVPSASSAPPPAASYKASDYISRMQDNDLYTAGMTRVFVKAIHLTEDRLAVLELYTSAQRDDKGEIMWDDGQQWALVVRDGDFAYPLLEKKYVQIGQVTCDASWDPDGGICRVTVRITQHDAVESYECYYEEKDDRFARVEP